MVLIITTLSKVLLLNTCSAPVPFFVSCNRGSRKCSSKMWKTRAMLKTKGYLYNKSHIYAGHMTLLYKITASPKQGMLARLMDQ